MELFIIPFVVGFIVNCFMQEVLIDDFDLDMLEREIKNGFDFGQTFEEIFGG